MNYYEITYREPTANYYTTYTAFVMGKDEQQAKSEFHTRLRDDLVIVKVRKV